MLEQVLDEGQAGIPPRRALGSDVVRHDQIPAGAGIYVVRLRRAMAVQSARGPTHVRSAKGASPAKSGDYVWRV